MVTGSKIARDIAASVLTHPSFLGFGYNLAQVHGRACATLHGEFAYLARSDSHDRSVWSLRPSAGQERLICAGRRFAQRGHP